MLGLNKGKLSIGEPIYRFENNHSVDFDGVNDFIQLGQPISYTQHTISAWIKLIDDGSNSTLIDARDSANDGWRMVISASQFVNYQLNSNYVVSPSAISVDEWHHIVGTYDGTTQKLYIDGSLVSSATTSQTINTTTNAEIGARNFSDRANEFGGKIDELAIWDRALTAAEVTEIYRIKYGANLVQNGRFDELGSELATNGDFAVSGEILSTTYSLGWVKFSTDAGNFISDGVLHLVHQDTGGFNGRVQLSNGVDGTFAYSGSGESYKLVYEIKENLSNSNLFVWTGSNYLSIPKTVGSHTFYYASTSGTQLGLFLRNGTNDSTIKLDNISIKQVDPNDRWTLGTGWSYGDSIASCDGTQSSTSDLNTTSGFSVQNNAVKVTFDLIRTAGTLAATLEGTGQLDLTNLNSSGTYTFIATSSDATARLIFRADADFIGTITNVMLEQQKYVATNLKLNSGNYKSADPVIVSTKSVDLDGTEEYLEVTKKDFLGTSDFTISMWIKPDTVSENNYFIGQSTDDDNRWYIRVRGSDNVVQFFSKNSGNQVISVLGGTAIANQWNHIVVTADRDDVSKLYLNGVLVNTASDTGASLTFTGNLRIGSFEQFGAYFDGTIDDVGIFNAALSSDQVIELYNQGVPGNLSTHSANANLTGYWKMGDGTLDEAPLIADQTNATLGSDLITANDFSQFNTYGTVSISNNIVTIGATSNSGIFAGLLTNGKIFKVTINVLTLGATGNAQVVNDSGAVIYAITTTGEQTFYFRHDNANANIIIRGLSNMLFSVSSISIKQVNGNPALMINTPTIVTDAPLTKIRNYYRMGDGILDKFPYINDMISPNLAEITSTNLVTHSTDLDSSFSKSNVTLESNAIISPDGTQNASYVKATSSTSVHLISDIMGTNDVIAMSIHAKQGGYTRFRFNSGSSSNGFASFNIATGTVVNTGGTYFYNADIEDVGDGWYRCKMVLIGTPGTGMTVAIEDDDGQVAYTGDTSKGIYFWGAQGEVQRQVTPLITTTGSTVTRTATIENNYGSMINMSESDITNDVPS